MNNLTLEKKALILSSLVEGTSIRSTVRITGASKNTVTKLLLDAGERAQDILDTKMINLKCQRIQVDEIWCYVAKKEKRVKPEDPPEYGDQYTFIALDADTKLVPCFRVGKRTGKLARSFLMELSIRVPGRIQLSTDSFAPYYDSVDRIWGTEIDYAQIHKEYAENPDGEKRYSPARIIRMEIRPLIGQPDRRHTSTSYVERQNLTIRMASRRFTRLTNAFSKKLKNLEAALALHFYHYNFIRIHETLRVTPAMQAGITRHLWTWEELLNNQERKQAA
jgi:IS1 family transposase